MFHSEASDDDCFSPKNPTKFNLFGSMQSIKQPNNHKPPSQKLSNKTATFNFLSAKETSKDQEEEVNDNLSDYEKAFLDMGGGLIIEDIYDPLNQSINSFGLNNKSQSEKLNNEDIKLNRLMDKSNSTK